MKLSTRARYGLRALIDLGVYSDMEVTSIQSIADRQKISVSYLEQLMAKLKRAGFVESIRGAGGGYRLAKHGEQISVGEVLRVLEGNLEAVNCSGYQEEEKCTESDICVAKYVWKRINDSIIEAVDTITLGELINESRMKLREK